MRETKVSSRVRFPQVAVHQGPGGEEGMVALLDTVIDWTCHKIEFVVRPSMVHGVGESSAVRSPRLGEGSRLFACLPLFSSLFSCFPTCGWSLPKILPYEGS